MSILNRINSLIYKYILIEIYLVIIISMSMTCRQHMREATVYDLDLNQTICERCALFDPQYKSHSFIEAKQLLHHTESLYRSFNSKLNALQLEQSSTTLTSHQIREVALKKISQEVASINATYNQMIKELQNERSTKVEEIEKRINEIVEEQKKSMKTLISQEYEKLKATSSTLKTLFQQQNYSQVCRILNDNSISERLKLIQKDLEMIYLQFNNKIGFVNHEAPYFLPLSRKQSDKEEILINNLENEFISMFDSLKDSRVSSKSNCKTEISFGSFGNSEQVPDKIEELSQSSVSLSNGLNTLKVHNKSEIKGLYIKNSTRQIVMSQLDMNNREALDAIRKCSFNNFVGKLDLSYNQINQKLIIQLKKEKLQSKYLKHIVVKGMKPDIRELKKEGLTVQPSQNGEQCISIGNIRFSY